MDRKTILLLAMALMVLWQCDQQTPRQDLQAGNLFIDSPAIEVEANVQKQDISVSFDYDTSQWIEIMDQAPFHLDLRYATPDNFVQRSIYPCGRCFLRRKAAQALIALRDSLIRSGYGLVIWDCYRPVQAQQALWTAYPHATYVTPPEKGSMHSRGLAIDVGLTDMAGRVLDLGSTFDYFGREAHRDYPGHPVRIQERRQLLDRWMESAGFAGIRTEWWHFSYRRMSAPLDSFQWTCLSGND